MGKEVVRILVAPARNAMFLAGEFVRGNTVLDPTGRRGVVVGPPKRAGLKAFSVSVKWEGGPENDERVCNLRSTSVGGKDCESVHGKSAEAATKEARLSATGGGKSLWSKSRAGSEPGNVVQNASPPFGRTESKPSSISRPTSNHRRSQSTGGTPLSRG